MIVGFTTMIKILDPSSKVVTSPMVAIGIMLTIKAIFFQVNTPLMGLRFTLIQKLTDKPKIQLSMATIMTKRPVHHMQSLEINS